ncbi:MAG: ASCH domain-containing protein [Methylobacteriaceae bacterium]|jgi:predicted transcriptional regulator|uniref:ASCH domain-containing protein n=1 Tax=Methylorubrum zatmanii TaxID=29429 RepID=A0ABW1WNG5_9HYPH|nr:MULTISPECIES: ASCH domain-containing protein [Methylorubrum]MBB5764444.1 putative transcriptional regulator [Methylorubrum rhodesianum]MBD8908737.1 hypothetical protein [Methylorubrum zatmanii]MDV2987948.1 ASCH domain-containing protein [Methylobacteriaceae bacterium AG10]
MGTLDLFRHNFVLSIKPQYATRIVDGVKTVELRRRFPYGTVTGARLYVYASVPIQALIGYATISTVERLAIREIWEKYEAVACIASEDFDTYFRGRETGYVVRLVNPIKLANPVGLPILKAELNFTPPQSFAYAHEGFERLVDGS